MYCFASIYLVFNTLYSLILLELLEILFFFAAVIPSTDGHSCTFYFAAQGQSDCMAVKNISQVQSQIISWIYVWTLSSAHTLKSFAVSDRFLSSIVILYLASSLCI